MVPDAAGISASNPGISRRDNLAFLDATRGIAIICVFAYHTIFQAFDRDQLAWNGWLRNFDAPNSFLALYPITWGWCGVAIFFVVSGFCIHLSFARSQNRSITEFYSRRFFRIYPPYFVALLFFAFVFPYTRLNLHLHSGLAQFFSHLFLVHNLDSHTKHGIVVAWWSIAVEFQLYLLYPLLLAAAQRIGWRHLLICTAVIELGLRLASDTYSLETHNKVPALLGSSAFDYLFSWTIGASMAEAYLNGRPSPFARTPALLWIALLIAADLFKPLNQFSFTFAALATAAILGRLLSAVGDQPQAVHRSSFSGAVSKHLDFVGKCSYAIYLIHHPIVEAWPRVVRIAFPTAHEHPVVMYICCLTSWCVIVPLSYAIYRGIELPSIDLGKAFIKYTRRFRTVPRTAGLPT